MNQEEFSKLVGLEVAPGSDGSGIGHLDVEQAHLNPNGVVHGGALFTLMDTAMGCTVMECLEEGYFCATIQITMNFLKPVFRGTVNCKTHVVNQGKRVANVRGELYVGDTLVGTADGNFAIIQPK